MSTGVGRPAAAGPTRLVPLDVGQVTITGDFWAERLQVNRDRTIPHGFAQLERAGTLDNLRLAAGARGRYQALTDSSGSVFPFLDSDVYKWLEAVGWELGRAPHTELAEAAEAAIAVVAAAQRPDGYINSYVQVMGRGEAYRDLAWGHEFYCVGHLIQAAVAWHKALGDDRLLAIATRAADAIERTFGAAGRDGIDGHPLIEMALVDLARVTGEPRYATLAARLIDERGHGLLAGGRFGSAYWQDHETVRKAATVAGHAVRQLYLDCGAVDVAEELGDTELLDAVQRRWRDMVRTRMYLTGGLGSRSRDEAFGDPFELPPDQAYAETCASIASVMLGWRLLRATGDPVYADAIERAMFNGVLAGLGRDGTGFFYDNPLQRRTHRATAAPGQGERQPWFACACCPPNLMRLLSSWPQYLATTDANGIQVHQYATAEIRAVLTGGPVLLAMETDYPWNGKVTVRVLETPETPWTLSLRVPGWYRSSARGSDIGPGSSSMVGQMFVRTQTWRRGDRFDVDFEMPVRIIEPEPEIDAIRGCVAVARGPLVYAIETVDAPEGSELEDLRWDPTRRPTVGIGPDIGGPTVGIDIPLAHRAEPAAGDGSDRSDLTMSAIPYHLWANRRVGAMRVWIPLVDASDPAMGVVGPSTREPSA